ARAGTVVMLQPPRAEFRQADLRHTVAGPDRRDRGIAARRRGALACALAAASLVAVADPAAAQTKPANAPIAFDIPSQSLNAALGRYGDATGREALYDASLTAGRTSSEIRGVLAPDDALRRLLSGTGLTAEFIEETTFVLLPAPETPRQAGRPERSP